jgi:hypothetical protein
MRLWAAVLAVAGGLAVCDGARADCEGAQADSIVAVPKGKAVLVMYLRPGQENNWLEVCARATPGDPWMMQVGEFANATDWYQLWLHPAQAADYQLILYGTHFGLTDLLEPWKGARRTDTPYGYTLAFFATDPAMPNTIAEVCVHGDLGECPAH